MARAGLIILGLALCLGSTGDPTMRTEVRYACDVVAQSASPWPIKMLLHGDNNRRVSKRASTQHSQGPDHLLTRQFTLTPAGLTADCLPECHEDYQQWLDVGKPTCWCHPRQCHGDADGVFGGNAKTGHYRVGPLDLNLLLAAWMVKEPPHGPGIASIQNGICADFAHDRGGDEKTGYFRVGVSDLDILVANWLVKRPPEGPGIPADCRLCKGQPSVSPHHTD